MYILTENWHTWYFGGVDSEPRLTFLKFWPQNPFFGQIWAQNLKVVYFIWKSVHMVSQGYWFLFQHQFPEFQILISFLVKFGPKKSKMSVLTENWYTWYLGSVDSKSRLRFLKFHSQNPFLGKFWPKKSKLCVFPENWHAWHLDDADSYCNLSVLNFWP